MSYNGVGLSTPRGSGTNGHIQANRGSIRPRESFDRPRDSKRDNFQRAPDAAILEHERKRRVEVKCLELQMSLEDDGLSEEHIQNQVDALRASLLAQSASSQGVERDVHSIKSFERHELGQAKEIANERLRKAMGIRADHVEGRAFDREAQAQDKITRAEERERLNEERKKQQEVIALERERARKERDAQAEKHRREMDDQRRQHQRELEDARRSSDDKRKEELKRLDAELDQRTFGAKRDRSTSPQPKARAKTPPGMRRIASPSPPPRSPKQVVFTLALASAPAGTEISQPRIEWEEPDAEYEHEQESEQEQEPAEAACAT